MANHLFLASTPFNVITAAMVAFSLPEEDQAWLWLIDQQPNNNFSDKLPNWRFSPFNSTEKISQQVKGQRKRIARLKSFQTIQKELDKVCPDWIYTGNDRRIEFQYAMSRAQPRWNTQGAYLDDGTYSYVGRQTHWLKDGIIDNYLKKVVYGSWWKQPLTVGASSWINTCWLAFPDEALPILKQRTCQQLPLNLTRYEFQELAKLLLPDGDIELTQLDALILLSHESASDKDEFAHFLKHIDAPSNKVIGYKCHPRSNSRPPTDKNFKLIEVPNTTPMEILLPLLPANCVVIGGVSTALLTTKWLRNDIQVRALLRTPTSSNWTRLLNSLDVELIQE